MANDGKLKKLANRLEADIADYLGIYRVPCSGSTPSWKGDVEGNGYLIDSKNSINPVVTVLAADLAKITREARESNKIEGHLVISFVSEDYSGFIVDDHWAVVPDLSFELESTKEFLSCKGSKKIPKMLLSSVNKRAFKKNLTPSVHLHFEKITFGTPKNWLVIPIKIYKEIFHHG